MVALPLVSRNGEGYSLHASPGPCLGQVVRDAFAESGAKGRAVAGDSPRVSHALGRVRDESGRLFSSVGLVTGRGPDRGGGSERVRTSALRFLMSLGLGVALCVLSQP